MVYLGFEYRSVQEPERRGFAVKPVVKALTEQKSANVHDETTVCDRAEHALFRAVFGKLQYITGVRPDLMFVTKCLSYKLALPTLAGLDTCQDSADVFEANTTFESLLDDPCDEAQRSE